MSIPLTEHPYSQVLLRARQLSAAHDEMQRMIKGVIGPEFSEIIQVFAKASYPWDVEMHGHGVILNFGKPDKPFTIAYYGYPEENEFELAITVDSEEVEPVLEEVHIEEQQEEEELLEDAPAEDLIDFGVKSFGDDVEVKQVKEDDVPLVTTSEPVKLGKTETRRIWFQAVFPADIKLMFEKFLAEHAPELEYKAEHESYELHDLGHSGPYQLRIEDAEATSVVATVEDFRGVLNMASTLSDAFKEKELIITEEDGSLVC